MASARRGLIARTVVLYSAQARTNLLSQGRTCSASIKVLRPTILAEAIWCLDLASLRRSGIRGIILDLDNTIANWNEAQVHPKARAWIEEARRLGMRICLASNALRAGRVSQVARSLDVPALTRAGKPFPRAFRRAMLQLGTEPQSTCAIGDQIFTDILGANRAGLTTVLVSPLSPRESPHTRLIRLIERPLRRRWQAQQQAKAKEGGRPRSPGDAGGRESGGRGEKGA